MIIFFENCLPPITATSKERWFWWFFAFSRKTRDIFENNFLKVERKWLEQFFQYLKYCLINISFSAITNKTKIIQIYRKALQKPENIFWITSFFELANQLNPPTCGWTGRSKISAETWFVVRCSPEVNKPRRAWQTNLNDQQVWLLHKPAVSLTELLSSVIIWVPSNVSKFNTGRPSYEKQ